MYGPHIKYSHSCSIIVSIDDLMYVFNQNLITIGENLNVYFFDKLFIGQIQHLLSIVVFKQNRVVKYVIRKSALIKKSCHKMRK